MTIARIAENKDAPGRTGYDTKPAVTSTGTTLSPRRQGMSPGRVLNLQRSVGNRGVAALVARLVPGAEATVPHNDTSGYRETRAQEEARLAGHAQGRADARRLLPVEIEEVGGLDGLTRPAGPDVPLGSGTRKLLDAVDRLGSNRNGAPSAYKRDPAQALPSFIVGDKPEDPDGRISVTSDGLLEVTRAIRTTTKARKGRPATTTVKHKTVVVDLLGAKLTLKKGTNVAELFRGQAQSAVEKEAQQLALGGLENSTTPVAGGDPEAAHLTIGELTAETDPDVYLQRAYTGKEQRQTELFKKVRAAFDELRAEFEAFKPPKVLELFTFYPDNAQLARAFAAKLQPTLFETAAAAQSELDQATAALAAAETELAAAKETSAALNARKTATKEEGKALRKEKDAARDKQSAADQAVRSAKRLVAKRTVARDALVADRDSYLNTITWILDPDQSVDPTKPEQDRAAKTVGSLCNVLSFFLYGKAVGVVPADTDFKDYYLAEVKSGRIRYGSGSGKEGVYMGVGSLQWSQERQMVRIEDPDLAKRKPGEPAVVADPIGHPSRKAELDAFLGSGANVAITHQDLEHTPPAKAHHFLLIVKDDFGVWRNLDHTSSSYQRRGGITDWNRVFRVETDAALVQAAQKRLEAAAVAP